MVAVSSTQSNKARMRLAEFRDVDKLSELYRLARKGDEDARLIHDWLEQGGAMLLEDAQGSILSVLRWQEDGEGWQLERIATLPEHRGKGFGRWLLTTVEALAIKRNIASLALCIPQHRRQELASYYGRMGYRDIVSENAEQLCLQKRVGGIWQSQTAS